MAYESVYWQTNYEVWWQEMTSYKSYPSTLTNVATWPYLRTMAEQLSSNNQRSQKKHANQVQAGWASQAGKAG